MTLVFSFGDSQFLSVLKLNSAPGIVLFFVRTKLFWWPGVPEHLHLQHAGVQGVWFFFCTDANIYMCFDFWYFHLFFSQLFGVGYSCFTNFIGMFLFMGRNKTLNLFKNESHFGLKFITVPSYLL